MDADEKPIAPSGSAAVRTEREADGHPVAHQTTPQVDPQTGERTAGEAIVADDEQDPYSSIAKPVDPYASIAKPVPSAEDDHAALLANPKGEGTYGVQTPSGDTLKVPYSNVPVFQNLRGYSLTPEDEGRFSKDAEADPKRPTFWNALTNPVGSGGRDQGVAGGALQIGGQAVKTMAQPVIHPVDTVMGAAHAIAHPVDTAEGMVDQFKKDQADGGTALAVENAAGQALGTVEGGRMLGAGAKGVVDAVPEIADKAAPGIINRAVGATAKDFKRGANPGRGYMASGGGVAGSMDGLAEKGAARLDDIGGKLRDAYDEATAAGKKIPAADVESAIDGVINDARTSAQGPGVMADPAAYDELKKTFEPSLQAAKQNGGFTPRELWDIRKNIDRNLNWGDQSKLNLTKVQQRVSGSLGGLLKDNIPETRDLSQTYQDLTSFRNRAAQRALTHSSPLTSLVSKAGLASLGALAGSDFEHVGLGLGAVAGTAADSIPLKTGVATALNAAARTVDASPVIAPGAGAVAGAASLGDVRAENQPGDVRQDNEHKGSENPANSFNNVVQQRPPRSAIPIMPAGVAPHSHVFSIGQWLAKNPGGDVGEAEEQAKSLGFEVVK